MRFKLTSLFILCFFIYGYSQKADAVYERQYNKSFYNDDRSQNNPICGYIQNIFNVELGTNACMNISFKENVEADFNNSKLNYFISDFLMSGIANFNNLNIIQCKCPLQLFSKISLIDTKGKEIKEFILDTLVFFDDFTQLKTQFFLPTNDTLIKSGNLKILFKDTEVFFPNSTAASLQNFKKQTEVYPKLQEEIVAIKKVLQNINPDNIDMVPLYQIDMNSIERQLQRLQTHEFFNIINLTGNDPLNILAQIEQLKKNINRTHTIISHLMESIDEVYYNKAYAFYLKQQYDNAINYFERSIRVNAEHYKSHYRLAEVFFIQGHIEKAATSILLILNSQIADKNIRKSAQELATQVQQEYNAQGRKLINEEQYHQALIIFSKADTFCQEVPEFECSPLIIAGMIDARMGLYRSYLTIAQKAIENNRLELASKFIADASSFQKAYSSYIKTNDEANQTMQLIINKLIEKGYQHTSENRFDIAVELLEKAYALCAENPGMSCGNNLQEAMKNAKTGLYKNLLVLVQQQINADNYEQALYLLAQAEAFEAENPVSTHAKIETENLKIQINKIKYKNLIEKGHALFNMLDYDDALVAYMEAKKIEKDYILFPNPKLLENIQNAARPLIAEAISQARIKVWGNDLPAAKALLKSINVGLEAYFLKNDSNFVLQTNDLENWIKKNECSTFSLELNNTLNALEKLIDNTNDYESAFNTINPFYESIQNYTYCNINTERLNTFYAQIKPLADYTRHVKNAIAAFKVLDLNKTDSIMSITNSLYKNNQNIQKHLTQLTLSSLLSECNDCFKYLEIANKYLSHNPSNALIVLKIAAEKQCLTKDFKDLQKKLGKIQAKTDKQNGTLLTKEELLQKFNNAWFAVFNRAYIKSSK